MSSVYFKLHDFKYFISDKFKKIINKSCIELLLEIRTI